MKILSLDQAAKKSGWAVFDGKKLADSGTFTIPAGQPIEQRLYQFMQELNTLYNRYEFKELYFEDIQNQFNNQTYKKLAYIQATVLIWCYSNDVKYKILAPSHWRKILVDDGAEPFGRKREDQKQKAIEYVRQKYKIEVDSDIADAICIGTAGIIEKRGKKRSAF